MNYQTEVEKRKLAKQDANQAILFAEFMRENPGLDYEAARRILRKAFEDTGELWTLETLRDCSDIYVKNGTLSVRPAPSHEDILGAEQEERESLTAWILANRNYQPESVAPERARFLSPVQTHIQTLRDIKSNILKKRELQALPQAELKSLAAGERPGAPELPANISRAQILHMLDADQIKHLIARYGADAVTKRVNEGRGQDE
jgi:hypothetical protein